MNPKLLQALLAALPADQVEAVLAELTESERPVRRARKSSKPQTGSWLGQGFLVRGFDPKTKRSSERKFPIGFFDRRADIERNAIDFAEELRSEGQTHIKVREIRVSAYNGKQRSISLVRELDE